MKRDRPLVRRLGRSPAALRILVFLLLLVVLWLPIAGPLYWWFGDGPAVTIPTLVLLYGEFIFLARTWETQLYGIDKPLARYGLGFSSGDRLALFFALLSGLALTLGLFALQSLAGWLTWQSLAVPVVPLALEGLAVALGIGFAEELFFRGWLLAELERRGSPTQAAWIDAALFALAHFIKPWPEILRTWVQFPGLLLLGLVLVGAKHRGGDRLAWPVGLHGGMVWGIYWVNVGEWIAYGDRAPEWLSGVDGNPLAGVVGVLLLALLAAVLWRDRRKSTV